MCVCEKRGIVPSEERSEHVYPNIAGLVVHSGKHGHGDVECATGDRSACQSAREKCKGNGNSELHAHFENEFSQVRKEEMM